MVQLLPIILPCAHFLSKFHDNDVLLLTSVSRNFIGIPLYGCSFVHVTGQLC